MLACKRWLIFAAALLGAACLGCSENKLAQVSGLVTIDGTPVEKGTISLMPADGNAPTAEAIVIDGKYMLTLFPGTKNVSIHGVKKIGTRRFREQEPSSPMVDVTEEIVPARYNSQSDLTAEVKVGPQTLDFALTSSSE